MACDTVALKKKLGITLAAGAAAGAVAAVVSSVLVPTAGVPFLLLVFAGAASTAAGGAAGEVVECMMENS